MKVLRCDRCGEVFSGCDGFADVTTNPDGYLRTIFVDSTSHNIDICNACRVELGKWWDAKRAPTDVQPDVNEEAQNDTNN